MAVLHHKSVEQPAISALLAVFAGAAFVGCSLLLGLDALRVTDWKPHEAWLDALSVTEIWVEFSSEVDQTKTEQAFSLSENGSPMSGSFRWSGKRLLFTPLRPVSQGNDYEITVLSSAETKDGNSLAKDFRFAFSTKAETGRPRVLSFTPQDGSRVDVVSTPRVPVVVTFSEPVDQGSFLTAFSVSPDPGGSITFAGNVATFTPLVSWTAGTEYRVTITDDLKDTSGNAISAPVKFRFTAGADTDGPTLAAVYPTSNGAPQATPLRASAESLDLNTGFEADWGIELRFSKAVLRDNIESFIDFQPAWSFQIDADGTPRQSYLLVPRERLVWGSLYCLTVKKGVSDQSGNTTASDTRFMFKADGAASRPPGVERIRFWTNPPDPTQYADYTSSDAYSNLDLGNFPIGASPAPVSFFDLYLRLADGAAPDPFSLMHAFSVATTNGAAIIAPVAVALGTFADPQPFSFPGLIPVRISVAITNTSNSGIVTLAVSDSLTDTRGNKATAAFSLPLLK